MTTIYDLRCKMIALVRAGLIDREEYNSLFEVLCEAKNQLPQHADDVDLAVQLIEKLLPASPIGGRVYMIGDCDTVGLALAQVAHVQEKLSLPSIQFVGLAMAQEVPSITPSHYVGDMHLPISPEYLAQCCSLLPLDAITGATTPLPFRAKESIVREERSKLRKPHKPSLFCGYTNGRQARNQ